MRRIMLFANIAAAVAAGMSAMPNVIIDPRVARGRETLHTAHKGIGQSKYTGADLREIRAHGQARECARRLRRMGA